MKTVLVTGGSGMMGNAIRLIKDNYENYKYVFMTREDCDLLDWEQTYNYFCKVKPDYVLHFAAYVGGLFKNMCYKLDMLEKNLSINSNVLKAAHKVKVKKLISCLSTCIFPDKTSYPIDENMLHDGPPHNSNEGYAYAKRLLEIHSRAYREQYNDNFVCVIPTNIYGPYDNYNLNDAHVIPSLIHKCYISKEKDEPFVVCGTGSPLRQFIYSEDLAHLFMWVLENYEEKESIILSVSEKDEITIKDVAYLIKEKMGHNKEIVFDTSKADGQYKKTADNTKLMKAIKDFKFTSIEEGISKTVDWFMENYENCRK